MNVYYESYLMHHGIKGMKWGVRHDKQTSPRLKKSDFQGTKEWNRDKRDFGRRGANRIAKNQAKGMDRKAARYYEQDRKKYGERGARRIYKKSKGKAGYARDRAVIAESKRKFDRNVGIVTAAYLLAKHGVTPAKIARASKSTIKFGKAFYRAYSRHKLPNTPRIAPEMAWDPVDRKFHVV